MGCTAFCATALPLKIGYIAVWISLIASLTALVTPAWFEFSQTSAGVSGYQGLWTHCYWTNSYTCCASVDTFLDGVSGSTPGWMQAVRTMLLCSICTGIITLVLMTIQTCAPGKIGKVIAVIMLVSCFATATFLVTAVITYAIGVKDSSWTSKETYSFCFYATLFSCVGYLAAGVMIILVVFCLCCVD